MENFQKQLKVLSGKHSIKFLEFIREKGEVQVSEIYNKLGYTQAAGSHILTYLADVELVNRRQDGIKAYYYINEAAFRGLCNFFNSFIKNDGSK